MDNNPGLTVVEPESTTGRDVSGGPDRQDGVGTRTGGFREPAQGPPRSTQGKDVDGTLRPLFCRGPLKAKPTTQTRRSV